MSANVKEKTTVKLRASADCPSHSLANISVRDIVFAIDEPKERGGTDKGPTPTETALAALIGCTNVIGHKCANNLGIDIGQLEIIATCDFDRRGVTLAEEIEIPFQTINLRIQTSNAVPESDLNRLSQEVSKFCPLSILFRQAGTIIEEEWISA
ncbi:MAG: OsmC family protein [Parvularculales bacterium]